MKKNSESLFEEIDAFFREEPTSNQKAWGIIHEFYNHVLLHMKVNGIKKAELARRLGISRAAVTQMFNKTPNVSIRKLVEIADAVGIEFHLQPKTPAQSNRGQKTYSRRKMFSKPAVADRAKSVSKKEDQEES